MQTEPITIAVDGLAAQAYRAATALQRLKLDALLSLRLREATDPAVSLDVLMRQIIQRRLEMRSKRDVSAPAKLSRSAVVPRFTGLDRLPWSG